jgi:selenocysteine-specific elongation factor
VERRVILGTAGHIDHGKTALVRALTGVDTDRLPEEKRRGITIDLGFAPLEIEGVGTIGIVDVPGHENFVKTMLAGASGIDLAMLVIAADAGIMPQTREHLEILSLLGIPSAVIAVTKCDLVESEWLALVVDEVSTLIADTPFASAEIIPVSSTTRAGLGELEAAIARAALGIVPTRRPDDLFRMPVDRAFTIRGTGTVVTGTVWSGSIERDATVWIQPAGMTVRVRTIQSHGRILESVGPGTRAALSLAGCQVADVRRGSEILGAGEWMPTSELDASLRFISADFSPASRTRVRLHIGTSDTGARFSGLRTGEDGAVLTRLILDEPVVARGGDRVVIRLPSPARTVAGGTVLDPHPERARNRAARKLRISRLPSESTPDRVGLRRMLLEAGSAGISLGQIPIRTGMVPGAVAETLERLGALVVGDRAIDPEVMSGIEGHIEGFIAIEMANHSLEPGVSLQTVRASAVVPAAVMDRALDRLVEGRRIVLDGSIVRPAGWVSQLGEREQALSDAILHEICTHAFEPPSVMELSAKFGGPTASLMRRLGREGKLERVADDRYYAREAVTQMVETLRSRLESGRIYSPSELKAVLGVSRKYVIPFLEFCDRTGVTERRDEGRLVRQAAEGG